MSCDHHTVQFHFQGQGGMGDEQGPRLFEQQQGMGSIPSNVHSGHLSWVPFSVVCTAVTSRLLLASVVFCVKAPYELFGAGFKCPQCAGIQNIPVAWSQW